MMCCFLSTRTCYLYVYSLVKKTREHLKTMGETGAGITSEDQIRMDEVNEFTNKWSANWNLSNSSITLATDIYHLEIIKAGFPWLWEMKELISERPNVVPVGLGNNNAEIDMSLFATGYNSDNDGESSKVDVVEGEDLKKETDRESDAGEVNEASEDVDDDEVDVTVTVPQKRTGKSVEKKTAARPGKSN